MSKFVRSVVFFDNVYKNDTGGSIFSMVTNQKQIMPELDTIESEIKTVSLSLDSYNTKPYRVAFATLERFSDYFMYNSHTHICIDSVLAIETTVLNMISIQ